MFTADLMAALTSRDLRGDGVWVSKVGPYQLWFEFLAVSPSYQLARRYRLGKSVSEDALPADFDQVLRVYDDLGDVQRALFHPWWRTVALKQFGFVGSPPVVTRIGYAPHQTDDIPDFTANISQYFENQWVEQGRQRTMLLAIPVGMPEGKILRQVKARLSKIKKERRTLIETESKYPLLGKRQRVDSLMRYLRAVWLRSALYKQPLWKVGLVSKVSFTYSNLYNGVKTQLAETDQYDREMLTIIMSRALLRGRMISENAARGRFPLHAPFPEALEFDYKELRQRIHRRSKWQTREVARYKQAAETPEP